MLPNWKQNDHKVNGVSLHYTRTGGDGSINGREKPALVLAHGFSDNGLCWLPVAQALESGYDVILPDARGHGHSQRVNPGETFDQVEDLAGLIAGLGVVKPVVGGHSMGASTASLLAERYPNLVRAAILEDPPWWMPKPPEPDAEPDAKKEPSANPWLDWLKSLPNQTMEEVMAYGRKDNPNWAEVEFQPWAASKKQFDLNFPSVHTFRKDWQETVAGIRCPALLITGDPQKGAIVGPEVIEIARSNPNIQVVTIPEVGHSIRRENFEAYITAVREFLAQIK